MIDQARVLAEDINTPDIPIPGNLMPMIITGISIAIVLAVGSAILRSIPKWVFGLVALIAILIAFGIIKK